MLRVVRLPLIVVGLLLASCAVVRAEVDETKPVFDNDCVSFAGRFLGNAPVKKKAHPGLRADGSIWSMNADKNLVEISRIFPGEAAEKAGIEAGDQILSVNGYLTEGATLRDVFSSYHMYDPATSTETLVVRKHDGTHQTIKLHVLPLDQCNAEEKHAWLDVYKNLGF